MLSTVSFQAYIIAKKEIKMLERKFVYIGECCFIRVYGPPKQAKPQLKVFLRKSLNFRTKRENF